MSKALVKPKDDGRRTGDVQPDPMPAKRLPSVHSRMRARRFQLGFTGAELAQRAGISPSYVSLIESGAKIPDEGVAAELARALDDDEALYRAWARAARLGLHDLELLNQLDLISRTPAFMDLVESGEELRRPSVARSPAGEGGNDLAARLREVAFRIASATVTHEPALEPEAPAPSPPLEPSALPPGKLVESESVLRVPIFPRHAGADRPTTSSTSREIGSRVLVDPVLVAGSDPEGLFAYEVSPGDMKHLRGIAAPGDLVVLGRGGSVAPDRICAVQTRGGIVLARVILKGRSLLLLPGEGEQDFESLEVRDAAVVPDMISGAQVLLIRR